MESVFRLVWVWLAYPWSWASVVFQSIFPDVDNAFGTFVISMACYFAIFKFIVIPIFGSGVLLNIANRAGNTFSSWVNKRD